MGYRRLMVGFGSENEALGAEILLTTKCGCEVVDRCHPGMYGADFDVTFAVPDRVRVSFEAPTPESQSLDLFVFFGGADIKAASVRCEQAILLRQAEPDVAGQPAKEDAVAGLPNVTGLPFASIQELLSAIREMTWQLAAMGRTCECGGRLIPYTGFTTELGKWNVCVSCRKVQLSNPYLQSAGSTER